MYANPQAVQVLRSLDRATIGVDVARALGEAAQHAQTLLGLERGEEVPYDALVLQHGHLVLDVREGAGQPERQEPHREVLHLGRGDDGHVQIGRASCRERGRVSGGAVSRYTEEWVLR